MAGVVPIITTGGTIASRIDPVTAVRCRRSARRSSRRCRRPSAQVVL